MWTPTRSGRCWRSLMEVYQRSHGKPLAVRRRIRSGQGIGVDLGATQKSPPGKGKPGQKKARSMKRSSEERERQLEDAIHDFVGPGGVDGDSLRAITRIARGVFAPGLNINLSPVDSGEVLIGSRLQEGRQYLDSEPDILFARYGTEPQ